MSNKDSKTNPLEKQALTPDECTDVSRRDFLKLSSFSLAVPFVVGPQLITAGGREVQVHGPSKLSMEFRINGRKYQASLEPRVTLLDALRDHLGLTGAKRVCDRAECGACTVLMDNKAVYACSVLAIEAQTAQIATVESLMQQDRLHPVQQAFVDNDASQCGFCTPGFVMACTALLNRNPSPSCEDIVRGLAGNFCRCGTYDGIKRAIASVRREDQERA
jgi:xanthine dehydrogenase YagT iron-sulfur-binding subunit